MFRKVSFPFLPTATKNIQINPMRYRHQICVDVKLPKGTIHERGPPGIS
jgi:hypothetical protein